MRDRDYIIYIVIALLVVAVAFYSLRSTYARHC